MKIFLSKSGNEFSIIIISNIILFYQTNHQPASQPVQQSGYLLMDTIISSIIGCPTSTIDICDGVLPLKCISIQLQTWIQVLYTTKIRIKFKISLLVSLQIDFSFRQTKCVVAFLIVIYDHFNDTRMHLKAHTHEHRETHKHKRMDYSLKQNYIRFATWKYFRKHCRSVKKLANIFNQKKMENSLQNSSKIGTIQIKVQSEKMLWRRALVCSEV